MSEQQRVPVADLVRLSMEPDEPYDFISTWLKVNWGGKVVNKNLVTALNKPLETMECYPPHSGVGYCVYLDVQSTYVNCPFRLDVRHLGTRQHLAMLRLPINAEKRLVWADFETENGAYYAFRRRRNQARQEIVKDEDACKELELVMHQYLDLQDRVTMLLRDGSTDGQGRHTPAPFAEAAHEIKKSWKIILNGDVR